MQLLREENKAEGKVTKQACVTRWPFQLYFFLGSQREVSHCTSRNLVTFSALTLSPAGDVSPCIRRLRHVSSQGCDTCPQPLLGASRTPVAPKMRDLPIAKTLSRMQSCFAVFWMQGMHIFGLLRISIMDGWRRKADGSECKEAGCRNFLNCELFPGRRAAMPSNGQLQPESIGYGGN